MLFYKLQLIKHSLLIATAKKNIGKLAKLAGYGGSSPSCSILLKAITMDNVDLTVVYHYADWEGDWQPIRTINLHCNICKRNYTTVHPDESEKWYWDDTLTETAILICPCGNQFYQHYPKRQIPLSFN